MATTEAAGDKESATGAHDANKLAALLAEGQSIWLIANTRLAYARFREVFGSERFARLKALGASELRPLWASTSVKNPAYRDVQYVELIAGVDRKRQEMRVVS